MSSDIAAPDRLGPLNDNTAEERRQATLTVCGNATDVTDAHLLLTMLGLEERS